jgi:hypothetical protein
MSGGVLDISHHLFSVGLLGFVDFVVNLLNRPTDGATVHALKSAYEKVRTKKCVLKRVTSCLVDW